jgi:hypothetical protein
MFQTQQGPKNSARSHTATQDRRVRMLLRSGGSNSRYRPSMGSTPKLMAMERQRGCSSFFDSISASYYVTDNFKG